MNEIYPLITCMDININFSFDDYVYNKGRVLKSQFEWVIREGNADLVTIEVYQG